MKTAMKNLMGAAFAAAVLLALPTHAAPDVTFMDEDGAILDFQASIAMVSDTAEETDGAAFLRSLVAGSPSKRSPQTRATAGVKAARTPCSVVFYSSPGLEAGTVAYTGAFAQHYVGDTITVQAAAQTGYTFETWLNNDTDEIIRTNRFSFVLEGDCEWTAYFRKNGEYYIAVDKPFGSLTVSPRKQTFAPGSQVTLNVPPKSGRTTVYEMSPATGEAGWTRLGTNGTFTMPPYDIWVRALFSTDIEATSNGHGTVALSPPGPYYEGDRVTLTMTPDSGYHVNPDVRLLSWFFDDVVFSGNTATFTVGDLSVGRFLIGVIFESSLSSITSPADWDKFADLVNSGKDTYEGRTVTLLTDIDPVTNTVGTAEHPFRGTFDGGGHTLTVSIDSQEQCTALFREIDGATISNLVVAGMVWGGDHSACLVGACGTNAPNTIVDCTVSASVTGAAYLGGIVGHGRTGELRMERCVFSGYVGLFTAWAGGLLGWCDGLTLDIRDCLVKGGFVPSDNGKYHPIACKSSISDVDATVENAYYLRTLVPTATGNKLIPGAEGIPASPSYVSGEWWYPVTAADGGTYYLAEPPGGFQTGDVTIFSAMDWEIFAVALNRGVESYATKNVTLAADITVSTMVGTSEHPFRGTFDGGGHTLTIAIADNDSPFAAPFSRIDGATISNLVVAGTVSSSQNHAAGLVGGCGVTAPNAIRDCIVSVAVSGAPYAGGIVGHGGQGELTLEGCVFDGSVSGFTKFAGGLMGWCDALALDIRDGFVKGSFDPAEGGKFHPVACKAADADVDATLDSVYYLDALEPTATAPNIVHGTDPVSATYVEGYWTEAVTAADGGVYYLAFPGTVIASAEDWDEVAASVNDGTESFDGQTIFLRTDIAVSTCMGTPDHPFRGTFNGSGHTLTLDLSGDDPFIAPFRHIDGATIKNLFVAGSVESTGDHAAGLVGSATGTNAILNCTVSAFIRGIPSAGGFVGYAEEGPLRVKSCIFSGTLHGYTVRAGGILGGCGDLVLALRHCIVKGSFFPIEGGTFHPIACKDADAAVDATSFLVGYLNTLVPTETEPFLIPKAEGMPVNDTYVYGEWGYFFLSPDGLNYYCAESTQPDPELDAIILHDGETFTGTIDENTHLLIADGATVTLSNATVTAISDDDSLLWAGIDCKGDAVIVLAPGTTNVVTGCTMCPGIHVPAGKTLVIRGTGTLDARGGGDYAAGIGGGFESTTTIDFGNIIIEDGIITATGGQYAAGIGLGCYNRSHGGDITIAGGTVTAIGGEYGAGIGGGAQGNRGNVTITGGIVTATGGEKAAGIGGNSYHPCGNISISGGTVTARPGDNGAAIGSGYQGSCGDISITGGTIIANGSGCGTGIGSGRQGSCAGISISGGTVTASCTSDTAAIGSGPSATCGDISITGGTVTASRGNRSAAIGSGYGGTCGDIDITEGVTSVTAEVRVFTYAPQWDSPYSVGAGRTDRSVSSSCGVVTVAGIASGGIAQSQFIYDPTGQYHVVRFDANDGSGRTAAQFFPVGTQQKLAANPFYRRRTEFSGWDTLATGGGVAHAARETIDDPGDITFYAQWTPTPLGPLTPETGEVVLFDGDTLTGTGGAGTYVLLHPGATVTLSNVDLTVSANDFAPIVCEGDATIILADGTENVVAARSNNCAAIRIGPTNTTLVIQGGGSLTATGWEYGAGIGGDFSAHSFGNIVIKGGTITAGVDGAERTSCHGAGIGSGGGGELVCGDITILGGTIVATGGYRGGAGIGSGAKGICGYINILGGTVTASGGNNGGAGIGTGMSGGSDDITIGSNIVCVVAQSSATFSETEAIGKGKGGSHANRGKKESGSPLIKVAENLVNTIGYHSQTLTPRADYATWAAENGISGAWDDTDADGIANVFRYAFGVAEGTDGLGILGVIFDEEGRTIVLTPPLANTLGFAYSVSASDTPFWTNAPALTPLSRIGWTTLWEDPGTNAHFYRLRAVPK